MQSYWCPYDRVICWVAKRLKVGASSLSPVRIEISAVVPIRVEQLYGLTTWRIALLLQQSAHT